MPSPGQLAPTRRMAKGTRTQKPPTRLPFKTDGPTTGARHEYRHCWALWQPNQTANFPALAITRVSGLTTNPGAKAFAPHLLKTHECRANNACINGGFCAAKRRKSRPVEAHRAGTNLMHLLQAYSKTGLIKLRSQLSTQRVSSAYLNAAWQSESLNEASRYFS